MTTPSRLPALDGLRGLAILLVIPHNANLWGDHPGLWWPLAALANAGWIGVQLFFVLSGFLITRGLLETRGARHYFRDFYARRALRILPLYYAVLLVGLLAGPALIQAPPLTTAERAGVPWLWLFLSNWVQPFGLAVPGFTHFWSLAVEEQFYLLWPFAVLALGERGLLRLCGALVLVAMSARLALPAAGLPAEASYVFTLCRVDALAAGALAAVLMQPGRPAALITGSRSRLAWVAIGTLGAGALATRLYDRHDWRTLGFGEPLLACAFAALIVAVAQPAERLPPWLRWLTAAPLRATGRWSYGAYVLHLPIILALLGPAQRWLQLAGAALPAAFALLAVVLSVTAGALSHQLFERHFLALQRRFRSAPDGMRTGSTVASR